jgi:hypothetical protein
VPLFGKHAQEFGRALANGEWELTKEGIHFPRQRALLHGHVKCTTREGSLRFPNRIMQGMIYTLYPMIAAGGLPAIFPSDIFVAPWNGLVSPTLSWENFITENGAWSIDDWTLFYFLKELGGAPEGYDETTRPQWVYADAGAGLIDNSASPAAFTMRSASSIEVRGFALLGAASAKQAARPYGWNSPTDPGGSYYANWERVDVTNGHFGVVDADSDYVPSGATLGASLGGGSTSQVNYGKAINLDNTVAPGDPNEGPVGYGTTSVVTAWFDPSGDDYFDAGLGHWVDPSGDSIVSSGIGNSLIAICELPGGPASFVTGDPVNITWGIQLS